MKKGILRSKLLAVGLSAAMVLTSGAAAFAADTQTLAATAPKVQLNGQNVEFKDAAPQNVDGRVMVPFTAMLEALGAKVDYDKTTKTVTAVNGDTTMQFQIGKPDLKLTKDGKTEDKTMDVAPFVDPKTNRTYVSTRFVSEAFGYNVGWDKAAKTVVIIDYNKMFANADKDFSILCMPDGSGYDMNKTYQSTGTFAGDLTLKVPGADGKTTDMKITFDASMNGLQKAMAADLMMKLNLNMDDFVKMLTGDPKMDQASKDQIQKVFDSLKNIQMEVKMGDDMILYMKSPLFTQLAPALTGDQKVTDDTWYKVDAGALYQSMGIDLKSLMQTKMSGSFNLGEMLTDAMKSASDDMTVDTCAESQAIYDVMKDLLGDQAFTTSGNVHTATISKAAVAASLAKHSKELNLSAEDMADLSKADVNGTIAITEDNGKNTNTKLNFTLNVDDVNFTVDMDGNSLNVTMKMALKVKDQMEMNMNISSRAVESTDTVNSTVPSGAQVIDLSKIMMGM